MTTHFESLFAANEKAPDMRKGLKVSVPVEPCEVQIFLDRLPARNAGAPGTAPGAVWRLCSLVSGYTASHLAARWDPQHDTYQPEELVPTDWTRAVWPYFQNQRNQGRTRNIFAP